MQNKEQIVQDLISHSKESGEFDFEFNGDFLKLIAKKDTIMTFLIYLILMLAIPFAMLLSDSDNTIKLFVSIIWVIAIGIRYYRLTNKNKDLVINLKTKEITTSSFISRLCIKKQNYRITEINEIKVKEFIASPSKYGGGLKFYEVYIMINNEFVSLCLVQDNSIANKIRNLIAFVLTEKINPA